MRAFGILLFLLVSANAHSYLRTLADSGRPLYWNSRGLSFSGNPNNVSGLTSAEAAQIFQNSASRWNGAGSGFSLTYNSNPSTPTQSAHDGVNAIYFASQSGEQIEFGVIGITQVLYYTHTGQIVEADIVFNDRQFQFTKNEGDTGRVGFGQIYLGDVATHELGHAAGLDHSTVGNSSMVYTAFSGQFALGQDDITGVQTIAPVAGGKGAITGTVVGTRGGMFGVHVSAINQATGEVTAGTLAESNGSFRIGDLPPGDYAVMMEPFGVSTSSISTYWHNVNHRFCGNGWERFRRTFYAACGSSSVTTVNVASGRETSIGTLTPSCAQMGNPSGIPNAPANALTIDSRGGARYGTIGAGGVHYYRLENVSGTITARVATYSLFSNVDTRVDLVDINGSVVAGTDTRPDVENPMPGGHTNYDAFAEGRNLPHGTYYVRITGERLLSSSGFPAGSELRDASGHYLLTAGINGEYGVPGVTDMSACVSVANTPQGATIYNPPSNDDDLPGGGCASIENPPNDIGSALGGPLFGLLGLVCWRAFRRSLAAIRIRR